eukprot:CAMPEP_0174266164 /NCGR_PEP_ID=MMETSP0439-20130205/29218_1 /TAXON_ID=0 /ORGANISM="Stereomyxa ramosa, Strain Chinc5" /LENGTH=104 /DNA_ID=CAMNT_0015352963 /DNA_START=53 /DNA_END=367 /DNA_ORIENTATION=-
MSGIAEAGILAGAGAAGVGTALGVTTGAIGWAGFTSAGITAGSWGAGLMASYGGAVASGSTLACLQTAGAAGLVAGFGLPVVVGIGLVGGAVGVAAGAVGLAMS